MGHTQSVARRFAPDPQRRALGRLDDAADLSVDAAAGTAVMDEMIQGGQRAFVQLSPAWAAVFVEPGRARSVHGR